MEQEYNQWKQFYLEYPLQEKHAYERINVDSQLSTLYW